LRRLKKRYTPDKIAKLYRKYSSAKKLSPRRENRRRRKFQGKLNKLVTNFESDYWIFRDYQLHALALISQSLISDSREEYGEINTVEELFAELETKKEELIFPIGEVETFKGQVWRLLKDLLRNIHTDETSDIRLSKGGYPVGIHKWSLKRFLSRVRLYRRERKEIKKLGQNLHLYAQLRARISQELSTGVQQDFLFLLIEVIKRVEIADQRLESIKQDLQLVLVKLGEENEHINVITWRMLKLLRNEPLIKDRKTTERLQRAYDKWKEVFQLVIKQDFKNTEALRAKLKELSEEGNVVILEMEQQAREVEVPRAA